MKNSLICGWISGIGIVQKLLLMLMIGFLFSSGCGFQVELSYPAIIVYSGPDSLTAQKRAELHFECQTGCLTECRLNYRNWEDCVSPVSYEGIEDGTQLFEVRAKTTDNRSSGIIGSWIWTVDTRKPEVLILTGPEGVTYEDSAVFTFECSKDDCDFICSLNADRQGIIRMESPCESGVAYHWLAGDEYEFSVYAIDRAGNKGDPAKMSWRVRGVAPPEVTDLSGPWSPTGETTAVFSFGCSKEDCIFHCSLEGLFGGTVSGYTECESGVTYRNLVEDEYAFSVIATDSDGYRSEPAEWRWILHTGLPVVWILDGPPEITNERTAEFLLACSRSECFYSCTLDGAEQGTVSPEGTCSSVVEFSGLADDDYTLTVRASDNEDRTSSPVFWRWRVDADSPLVTDLEGPASPTNRTDAVFNFDCSKDDCNYFCSLSGEDRGDIVIDEPCSPGVAYTSLADDIYTFRVHAVDEMGNAGPQSQWEWQIDTLLPLVEILSGPEDPTLSSEAEFSFVSSKPDCVFSCRLAGETQGEIAPYGPCASGLSYSDLSSDTYTFMVRATDSAGNTGPSSHWTWTLEADQPPLVVRFTETPPPVSNEIIAAFAFECVDRQDCSFECAMDYRPSGGSWEAGDWNSCQSPITAVGLVEGDYKYRVRATASDGAQGEASYSWAVVLPEEGLVRVSAGDRHNCGISQDNDLWCWGDNEKGQIGDGTDNNSPTPINIPTPIGSGLLLGWSDIACGAKHTCGILQGGMIWCWGDNRRGQLGVSHVVDFSSSPVKVGNDSDWKKVYAGSEHTCAIKNDDSLWCWGNNLHGQLGDGSDVSRDSPVRTGNESDWVQVMPGGSHTCGIRQNGSLWCWGNNMRGQLGNGTDLSSAVPGQVGTDTDWREVFSGYLHSCAIKQDNSLWCWGCNEEGQHGCGTNTQMRNLPFRVQAGTNWQTAGAGSHHNCGVRQDGSLWCWGLNDEGQLGDGSRSSIDIPERVGQSNDWNYAVGGDKHSCAIKNDGGLWCWGGNKYGQIGTGVLQGPRKSPIQVDTSETFTDVSVGSMDSYGVTAGGMLLRWGNNPEPVVNDLDFAHVAAAEYHRCAIKQDGSMWCWGQNWDGQLGDGTHTSRSLPVRAGTASDWIQVSTGSESDWYMSGHSCGLRQNGTLWCWGSNYQGQLGDGSTTRRNVPVQAGLASNWSQVAAGAIHTCAIRENGSLWCWGNNWAGQLGDGTTTARHSPAQVGAATNWEFVMTGAMHTCAIRRNGSLWCWGWNESGQLGDGSTENRHSPVRIGNIMDWIYADGGSVHTCGIRQNGSMMCWGSNEFGQLGDGTDVSSNIPVPVGTDTDWTKISAGGTWDLWSYGLRGHSCALKQNGSLWCWGDNIFEQLGDGSARSLFPVPVPIF